MLDASRARKTIGAVAQHTFETVHRRHRLTRFGSMYQANVLRAEITRHVTSCASVWYILLCGRYSIYARRSNFLWKLTFLNCVSGLLVFSLFHVYYCIIFFFFFFFFLNTSPLVISGHCCSDKEGERTIIKFSYSIIFTITCAISKILDIFAVFFLYKILSFHYSIFISLSLLSFLIVNRFALMNKCNKFRYCCL